MSTPENHFSRMYPAMVHPFVPQNGLRLSDEVNAVTKVDVSIVIPVFNEERNVGPLYAELQRTLSTLDKTCEILLVDDGSTDASFACLAELQARDRRICVIRLRRNFGQSAAFSAGFDFARGDVIVTMDADLQNDPADIPRLLESIDAGYDMVSGWRAIRKDPFLTRRLPSRIANVLISHVTGVKLHDYGCSCKAYRREIVKNIKLYGELHRFIPALASWMGVRVAEIPVSHAPRRFGKSKYSLGRTLRVLLDLLTVRFLLGYASRPIQIFGFLGLMFISCGTAVSVYLAILKLFLGLPLANRPLLLLGILLIVLGAQFIAMGLLGELIVRTYHETQGKPIYVIREVLETPSADMESEAETG